MTAENVLPYSRVIAHLAHQLAHLCGPCCHTDQHYHMLKTRVNLENGRLVS